MRVRLEGEREGKDFCCFPFIFFFLFSISILGFELLKLSNALVRSPRAGGRGQQAVVNPNARGDSKKFFESAEVSGRLFVCLFVFCSLTSCSCSWTPSGI